MELGTVRFTQPFAEPPYESCASTPQAARPPNTTITATAAIAKMRFCRGVRRPARGLVLAYMDAQFKWMPSVNRRALGVRPGRPLC